VQRKEDCLDLTAREQVLKVVMKLMYKNEEGTGKGFKVLPLVRHLIGWERDIRLLKRNSSVEGVCHKGNRLKGFAFPSPVGVHLSFLAQILLGLNDFSGQNFIREGEMIVDRSPVT